MTSLIRVTDVDTNQIKPFMPSDSFPQYIIVNSSHLRTSKLTIPSGFQHHLMI